ncbi:MULTISPECIES: hypothetical protein [Streptomyces]|uniref:hypothetical protein n=1 Tax=Streptomyces TaxID=1883 RepID=UPI00343FBA43
MTSIEQVATLATFGAVLVLLSCRVFLEDETDVVDLLFQGCGQGGQVGEIGCVEGGQQGLLERGGFLSGLPPGLLFSAGFVLGVAQAVEQ